jgi:hypothetical protein
MRDIGQCGDIAGLEHSVLQAMQNDALCCAGPFLMDYLVVTVLVDGLHGPGRAGLP